MEIRYWDRKTLQTKEEKVFSERSFRFLYENPIGYLLTQKFLVKPWFSQLYGEYYSRPSSAKKIEAFVQDYQINIDDFEDRSFDSFNDFFARKFKPGKRVFEQAFDRMPSPCEGRVLAFENLSEFSALPVKRQLWPLKDFLSSEVKFEIGPCLIFRLNPSDYHRFHFPDSGSLVSCTQLDGYLDSVNPLSLVRNDRVFAKNRRTVFELETKNFGPLISVAVAGLCVGRILRSHVGVQFARGDELGYFEFGGSTIVLLGERGAWRPSSDLLEKSSVGIEVYTRLGEEVATRN